MSEEKERTAMVAMIDPRGMTTMFVVERNAAAMPVTVMVVEGKGPRAGAEQLFRLVSAEEPVNRLEGEPTWEDAAWQ